MAVFAYILGSIRVGLLLSNWLKGALLILSPIIAGIAFIAFSLGYGIAKQVAVGSLVATFAVFGCSFFLVSNGFVASILVIMVLVIVLRHQNNIRSLLKNKKEG